MNRGTSFEGFWDLIHIFAFISSIFLILPQSFQIIIIFININIIACVIIGVSSIY